MTHPKKLFFLLFLSFSLPHEVNFCTKLIVNQLEKRDFSTFAKFTFDVFLNL